MPAVWERWRWWGKYPRFNFTPDSKWERMYRTVLENAGHGGEFELQVLQKQGYQKNTALTLPPPGVKAEQGFIPDSVVGNPEELVWGRPYRFVEVKARAEMALTGNLKAMMNYVRTHGGHIEVWFRSDLHPAGRTHPTGPLQGDLRRLEDLGRATVRYFPE
ncbi:hypothetical protein [Myxococcus sp. RHSTA-1-4]|uniref:hypothetical protein n=1 Tax=Myxococcus sp. RHSTA-1-4 TaxID=2874601 RepID=UPI001CBF2D70|nr:hypothetical protein [Myxococcus sp. RHSTA-1-4]MBZ4415419.1 hypothetical protein [Myxococcus sp. RHSTA-1-4]